MSRKTPRFYQRDAMYSALFAWSEYQRLLLHMGTGSGKTFTAASIINEVLPDRCLFVADSDELCYQPIKAINEVCGILPSIEKADQFASLDAKIVVASEQTLSKKSRLERFPRNHFKRVFVDEYHRGTSRGARIAEYFSDALICGMTATPFRSDIKDFSKFYDVVAYSLPMIDMIDLGFAPPWKVITLPVEVDLSGAQKSRFGDYDEQDAANRIEPWLDAIAKLYKERAHGRHCITFCPLKITAEKCAKAFMDNGVKAAFIAGDSPDRKELITRFEEGQIEVLCNASVLSTGVDIPIADCYLNLRPTKSISLYQQQAGRIARVLPGLVDHLPEKDQAEERRKLIAASAKPDALVLDVLWQHDDLGVIHPGYLVASTQEEAEAITSKTRRCTKNACDLIEIAKEVAAAREERLRKELEEAAKKAKRRMVDARHFASLVNEPKLQNYEPFTQWENEPPTPKQLDYLARHKIDPETVDSRGFAKALGDCLFHRSRYHFATPVQLRLIQRLKIACDHPEKLSQVLANTILQTEFRKRQAEDKIEREKKRREKGELVAQQDWP